MGSNYFDQFDDAAVVDGAGCLLDLATAGLLKCIAETYAAPYVEREYVRALLRGGSGGKKTTVESLRLVQGSSAIELKLLKPFGCGKESYPIDYNDSRGKKRTAIRQSLQTWLMTLDLVIREFDESNFSQDLTALGLMPASGMVIVDIPHPSHLHATPVRVCFTYQVEAGEEASIEEGSAVHQNVGHC